MSACSASFETLVNRCLAEIVQACRVSCNAPHLGHLFILVSLLYLLCLALVCIAGVILGVCHLNVLQAGQFLLYQSCPAFAAS